MVDEKLRAGITAQPEISEPDVSKSQKPAGKLQNTWLIVIGIGIALAVAVEVRSAVNPTSSAEESRGFGRGLLVGCIAGLIGALAIVYWFVINKYKPFMKSLAEHNDAVWQMDSGDVKGGAKQLETFWQSHNGPLDKRIGLLCRAYAHVLLGRPEAALHLYHEILNTNVVGGDTTGITNKAFLGRALCHAIRGNCAAAESDLKSQEGKLDRYEQFDSLRARTILQLRQSKFQDAVLELNEKWLKAEGLVTAKNMKVLRVLHAYALNQLGNSAEAAKLVSSVTPIRPGEFDYLAVHWPEFRSYLAETGLGGVAS